MEPSLKDQGNDEYRKGNYLKAAGLYTKAIKEDPDNAVLYSNRCAALLKLTKITKAMEDAEACIRLKPEWDKGYFRKGSVHEAIEQYKEALECYQQAQRKNPDNTEVSAKVRTLQKYMKTLGKQQATAEAAASRDVAPASTGPAPSSAGGGSSSSSSSKAAAPASAGSGPAPGAAGSSSAGSSSSSSSMAHLAGPVADFVEEWMSHAVGSIKDGAVVPSVHFLPGSPSDPVQEGEDNIRASNAFDSPGVLQEFCNFLAGMWRKLDARALVAIVPKSTISFPEVWRKAGWLCGASDGVFFQLLSPDVKAVLFIPVQDGTPRPPVELGNDFGILPWALGS